MACIENFQLNGEFEQIIGGFEIPQPDSCCMLDVCGLACPEEVERPGKGFTVFTLISVGIFVLVGFGAHFFITKTGALSFFVAERQLPLWLTAITLAAQSLDSNALLGNADLSYKFSFWDGAVLPLGLGISLILNGVFLAHHIRNDNVLTLPDVFGKRYGVTVELLVSCCTICSFLMLLAGNLVGFARVSSYVWDISEKAAIWFAVVTVWFYTISGGLYSVACTDILQGLFGWTGCLAAVYWLIDSHSDENAPPPSIGFPGYIYPDNIGDGGICDMYNGVSCTVDPTQCCYNEEMWCPLGSPNCDRYDRAAYPFGDMQIYDGQMTSFDALSPFPNAIFWNWATIVVLGFGNLAALDFQARCMASKTPQAARIGCILGGLITFFVGIPFAATGSITRLYYGPDSTRGYLEPDSCAIQLGLPTCALWVPDELAFIKLLTHEVPSWIGGWCLVGILAASMSTADGAILAMGTVFSHNVMRQFNGVIPELVTRDNLLHLARVATLPFVLIAGCVATFYDNSKSSAGATGYLLIVAFDIVFATVVVPLFGAYYTERPSACAALVSILVGTLTRVVLEFQLPKDGNLILPFDQEINLMTGPAASSALPAFIDAPTSDHWDPTVDTCEQVHFEDFTGVDSLSAPLLSLFVFVTIQTIENRLGRQLFYFPGSQPYIKEDFCTEACDTKAGKAAKGKEPEEESTIKEIRVPLKD